MLRLRNVLMLGALCALGCGDGGRAYVSGVVTLDGQPVPRGTVQFIPAGDTETATAKIGADGRYSLRSDDRDGLPPGKYRVRFDARELPKDERDSLPNSLLPARYASETESGLEFDVQSGRQEINLNLVSP